jgi:hypothetical protein
VLQVALVLVLLAVPLVAPLLVAPLLVAPLLAPLLAPPLVVVLAVAGGPVGVGGGGGADARRAGALADVVLPGVLGPGGAVGGVLAVGLVLAVEAVGAAGAVSSARPSRTSPPSRGGIRVACQAAPEGRVAIVISDDGDGIPADKMARLFRPFDRLGAEQSQVQGTGMGLAVSKGLMEAMGGSLTAESVVGERTTFTVELAAAAEAAPAPPR